MSTVSHAAAPARAATPVRPLGLARMSDELLARSVARGSERAFTVVYERYAQPIYRYCRSIVRNDADAQDALQSTFTSALVALRRGTRNVPLRPWLYRIAHNESVSILRRRRRDAVADEVPEPVALGSSAEDEAAGRARWHQLVHDLADLPERQRAALLLRELAGLSHEDIAVALGLSVGAAKQAIFEARQGLFEVEEGRAMSCEDVRRRISEGDRRSLRGRRVRSHLRACAACEAFAVTIPARRAELNALTPALAPLAAATVLGRVLTAAGPPGGASAAAGSAAAVGGAGKLAGSAVAWKALAGAAILATAAAGVNGLTHVFHRAAPAAVHRPAGSARPRSAAVRGSVAAGQHSTAAAPAVHHVIAVRTSGTAATHRGGAKSTPSSAATAHRGHAGNASAPGSAAANVPHGRALGHAGSTAHHSGAGRGRSAAGAHRQSASSKRSPGAAAPRRRTATRRHSHLVVHVPSQVSQAVAGAG
ncbi:MAG TPA: sigma-70 family RNA polymerase sigma factor, partial [Solirubrobacteraceae bacterium]|nr:sigma-70 family RNA polymerase sigma factor [Solirubrobacteraceae bacterium]